MAFANGAGFRIAGNVVRRFVSQSGKFAALTVDVNAHPRSKKIEMRCFSLDLIGEIESLTAGQNVEVTGHVDSEPVKNKKGEEVIVDGYKKYVAVLTVKALKVEGSSTRPAPKNETPEDSISPPPANRSFDDNGQGDFSKGSSKWPTDDGDVPF